VRTVDIHKPFADDSKRVQRRGRAVDKLAVRARAGERAFENELIFLTRLKTILVQKLFQRRFQFRHVKNGFDRAAFLAAADERAVGAFAEDEVERADDDGFARAGFAGDDVAT